MVENQNEIFELVDKRVLKLLNDDVENIDDNVFMKRLHQAKLGMNYIRDREIMKRISNGHMIRIINLIATDPSEKKEYIQASMPEISINKQIEG